jgi:hypothetical protein
MGFDVKEKGDTNTRDGMAFSKRKDQERKPTDHHT